MSAILTFPDRSEPELPPRRVNPISNSKWKNCETAGCSPNPGDSLAENQEHEYRSRQQEADQRRAVLVEFETQMGFDKPKDAGAGNENMLEFCSLSKEYSMLLKDPWSWEDSAGFGVRSIAAMRKKSYLLDYLHDSAVVRSTEEEVAEQQVEEEDCLRGSLFEATDDLLWRPQSPLPSTEVLFSLDSIGSHDCTTLLQDESIAQGASCVRIWEQDDDHKDDKNHAGSVSSENESEVSDWILGLPRINLSFLQLLNLKALYLHCNWVFSFHRSYDFW